MGVERKLNSGTSHHTLPHISLGLPRHIEHQCHGGVVSRVVGGPGLILHRAMVTALGVVPYKSIVRRGKIRP